MLSYRHSFHAGNFADVLKHVVLVEILQHLLKKDKPFTYIDTHAGAGLYALDSAVANKVQEYKTGIALIDEQQFPELASYFSVIHDLNAKQLTRYPGSPVIAEHFLRSQDHAWLHELHPADFKTLHKHFANDARFVVKQRDGYTGLLSLLPPPSRRGVVLIDPSYEIKNEYNQVIDAVIKSHKKFATGTYAIWYPVVQRARIRQMERRLAASGIKNIQKFELAVQADADEYGMTATGIWVINPPWSLFDKMQLVLPKLKSCLAQEQAAFYQCEVLVAE
ncbi:23S rRNA (adenine(2030)-N(6))-methyltransferase RlmJ [Marinicella litoralis]|uniref:Ribosomal RNA large subunit methyltransferase J n=1 Tax=Marinicella litoralis TaxID=644220 RepID=A0A4R6XRI5_9GAMM|nr:23S rRNA (adenine(2030)-N(6))-methyltransferase RlmJ [Marinicella litoralis]TDR22505.1 23S rRNA (adenine2030-N6)-methyltransferase [Marinicella litoralis]